MTLFIQVIFFITFCNSANAQITCFDDDIAVCKIDTSFVIYDYFNQRWDSLFCLYDRVVLIDTYKYCYEEKKPIFTTRKMTYEDGSGVLDIFIDGDHLFKYYMLNDKINGMGYIYYPRTGHIAFQGHFIDNKLDGSLFCLSYKDSEVIYSMLFKKGNPKKILYLFNIVETRKNYRSVNRRKFFRTGQCRGVIKYPFIRR